MIGEYLAEGAIAPLVMIKRGRYKFVHSPVDPDQLYDLLDDPDELRNLAPRSARTRARVQEFRAEVARRWDLPALHAEVIASQRRRHLVYRRCAPGRYTSWDFQPLRDASRLVCAQRSGARRPGGHGALSALSGSMNKGCRGAGRAPLDVSHARRSVVERPLIHPGFHLVDGRLIQARVARRSTAQRHA